VTTPPETPKPRNTQTQALNRRESLWQIYLPLGATLLAALACVVITILSAYGAKILNDRAWSAVSLMYLVGMVIVGLLPVLAVSAGLAAGAWYVLRKLPPYFKIVQDFMRLVAARAAEYSSQVANVFIAPRASAAGARGAINRARSAIFPGRKA